MRVSAISRWSDKRRRWGALVSIVALVAAFVYLWIVPLFRPRGDFLWGRYRLDDIYLGIPIGIALLCVLLVCVVPRRHRRPLSVRLIATVVPLLVVLVMFDLAYAFIVMGAWRPNMWLDLGLIPRRYAATDDELGFVRKPGVSWRGYVPDANRYVDYRTDDHGFRNPPGLARADVVFIGDSYTEAATVSEEDTFPHRVGRATGLRVVNLARGAYGPQQELIVLERYGLSYQPDVVVWQLFEGNDLSDARLFAEWKKNPGQGGASLKARYRDNSLLTAWLANTRPTRRFGPAVTLRTGEDTLQASLRYRYDPNEPIHNALGMAETARAIEAGQRLVASRGIELLVFVIPTMAKVVAPDLVFDREEDRRTYLPPAVGGQKDFGGLIEELCARIGCNFVDASAALRQAHVAGQGQLYIPNDEHFDVGGHIVVGQVIADWIRTREMRRPAH